VKPWEAASSIEQKGRKNALEPGIWLCASIVAVLPPVLIWAPFVFAAVYLGLCCLVVVINLVVFLRHSFVNPELLRSDSHSIQSKALDLIARDVRAGPHVRQVFSQPPVTIAHMVEEKQKGDR
jgi:Flp pilus assembly protein TadB